jgi:PAS domain S-box-containing protein
LIGKNIAQSLYYDSEERSRLLAELTSRGTVTDYEVTLKKRDGTPVPVSTSSHKYQDKNGNFLGVEGIFRDITERKRADEERTFKNVIMSTQQETSPDAILIVDENRKILNYNQKFIGIWGIPEVRIVSRVDEPVLQYVVAQLADPEAFLYRVGYLYDHKEEKSFEELLLNYGRILERFSAPMLGEKGKYYGRVWYFRDITKRKKMEDSLRANEEKYRSLVDNLNVGVYRNTAGFPGRSLWANPAFVRMLGYDSLQDYQEHPVTDSYVNPEERKKFIQMVEKDGFVRDYNLQLKKKDGTQIWVSIKAQAKKNPNGTIAWVDGICDDITALKDAEERSQYYQFEMSRAIDYLPDATFIIDRKGTVLAWNRAIEEMTGISAKDIIGKGDYEYAIPFYRNRRPILIDLIFASEDELKKGDYREIKRTGEILSVETPSPILKGKPAVLRAIAAPIYDEIGSVSGAIETITDITGLKRAQEDLIKSENRYRTIFENTGTATVLIEENTIISIANAEFERLSGYSREEIEGKKSWTKFVVKEDLERMLAQHHLRRERQEAALIHYDFRFVTKTGENHNIFLTIDVIPGTKKSVASLMDTTTHVRAQEALKLANRKLNLLSGITRHDLGNQLQAISGYLELSKKSLADPARTSELIDKEMHIADTIESMINFTRDYEGLGMNAPAWQNVHTIIGNVSALLPMRDIRVGAGDTALEGFADPLLERVFYNLIDNALRYGGNRMTAIRISSHMSGNCLVIIFEDDGAGIDIQDKARLFEKGFGKNTGLGLFLSREGSPVSQSPRTASRKKGPGSRSRYLKVRTGLRAQPDFACKLPEHCMKVCIKDTLMVACRHPVRSRCQELQHHAGNNQKNDRGGDGCQARRREPDKKETRAEFCYR